MRWLRQRSRNVVEPVVPAFDTDARRSDAPPRRGAPDPERLRAEKRKRRVQVLAFNVVFVTGVLAALVGKGGYFDLMRLQSRRDAAQYQLAEQRQRVEALREHIRRLESDPMAKERIAREKIGLARPGEIQFLLPREAEPAPPAPAPGPPPPSATPVPAD